MSPRRRAALLAGLAIVLGALAASDVSRREAAADRSLGPLRPVLVMAGDAKRGATLTRARLALRRRPARFAAPDGFDDPAQVLGRTLAVPLRRGAELRESDLGSPDDADVARGAPVRRGERVAQLIATAPAGLVRAGGRVDVLVTSERRGGSGGETRLALQDAEVLDAGPPPAGAGGADAGRTGEQVAVSLRVTLRQAVALAAAQNFARELRLLPRAEGDDAVSEELAAQG